MSKKLTITVDDEVYAGLHNTVGRWRIEPLSERPRPTPCDATGFDRGLSGNGRRRSASATRRSGSRTWPRTLPTSPDNLPQRGEVWWVAFDPAIGGEIRKTRPAVVVRH